MRVCVHMPVCTSPSMVYRNAVVWMPFLRLLLCVEHSQISYRHLVFRYWYPR